MTVNTRITGIRLAWYFVAVTYANMRYWMDRVDDLYAGKPRGKLGVREVPKSWEPVVCGTCRWAGARRWTNVVAGIDPADLTEPVSTCPLCGQYVEPII